MADNHPEYAFNLVKLMNDYRESKGVQPLSVDETLMDLSQDYTDLLKSTGQFTHTADGQYPWTRIAQSGFEYSEGLSGSDIGNENLHYGYSSRDGYHTPQQALEGWINSSGHNRNMLDPDWDSVGVGYAEGLYTANFGDAPDMSNDADQSGQAVSTPVTAQPEPSEGSFSPKSYATFDTPDGRSADSVEVKLSDLVDESGRTGTVRIEALTEGRIIASGSVKVSEPGGTFKIDHSELFDQIRVKSAEADVTGVVTDVTWALMEESTDTATPGQSEEDGFGPDDAVTKATPDNRQADSAEITLTDVVDASGESAIVRFDALSNGTVVASEFSSVREPGGTVSFDPSESFDKIRIKSGELDVTGSVDDIVFDFLESKPGSETNPNPVPKQEPIGDFERQVIELTNVERAERGLPPLRANAELNEAADRHAEDMASNNYFSHVGLDGDQAWDRGEEVGYFSQGYGENIARGQDTPEEVLDAWMNSSGHRANILNESYSEIGVGYEEEYWVQNFGTGDTNSDTFLA